MNTRNQQIIGRWNLFVSRIKERFKQSQDQAMEACIDLLIESNYDYYTVMRSWTGIKAQIDQLIRKVDDVWEKEVKYTTAVNSIAPAMHPVEITHSMVIELDLFQRDLEAELSQRFYNHAIQMANEQFTCSQCHSPLTIKQKVFRAHYVTCSYCQAVNTFTPPTQYAQIGWNVIDNLAEKQTRPLYLAMQAKLEAIEQQRPPVAECYWQDYEAAYMAYYQAYFKARAAMNADAEERYEADMARKKQELENYVNTHKKSAAL